MKKNLIYLIVLIAALAIFLIPGIWNTLKEQFFPVATIEKAVTITDDDYNIELKGINTADSNLKNFKGKKLLFLNFWGTWCGPCRKEWPSIQQLYDQRKDKMDFVLIAMQDKEEDVRKFLAENKYTVPVYIAQSPIGERILPKVFPTTYILSKDGRILMKEDAMKDWNSDSAKAFIDNVSK